MTASIYKFCLSGTIYMVKRKEAVNMKLQSITEKQIQKFRKYLVNEEKSDATIEKYICDVTFGIHRYYLFFDVAGQHCLILLYKLTN